MRVEKGRGVCVGRVEMCVYVGGGRWEESGWPVKGVKPTTSAPSPTAVSAVCVVMQKHRASLWRI